MLIIGNPCRRPTSMSLKSCAGVILTAPLPISGSAYSSGMIDQPSHKRHPNMLADEIGITRVARCTATAVSPSMVSGRVVANTYEAAGKFLDRVADVPQRAWVSRLSTSRSEMTVCISGSQLTSRLSR